jgi:hypothetical protein
MKKETFTWCWIKLQIKNNFKSKALLNLSLEKEDEPHRWAGKLAIYEWLDEVNAPIKYHEMVRELETEYHNNRSIAIQRILNGLGAQENDEV